MITPLVRRIYIADMRADADIGKHRGTKHCVCVSVSNGMYLLINTSHRDLYNDFQISASDYPFLNGVDRFLSCHKLRMINPRQLIREVGALSQKDTETVIMKITASKTISEGDKAIVMAELRRS